MTEKERKLQETKALFFKTKNEITKNPVNWQEYLKSGSRTYKYPLRDQILIHAQKPDVTACASFEVWSKTLNRGIKKGSKGIALLHNDKNGELKLDYVHDISNTYDKPKSTTGFLWEMKEDYKEAITQSMTARFGEGSSPYFENNLMEWCQKSVNEHFSEEKENLMNNIEGSFLEELDELNVEMSFKRALTSSVQFSVLSRCRFEPTDYLEKEDFQDVFSFNTDNLFAVLGNSIIKENCDILNQIGDIARTVEKGEYQKNLVQKLENDLDNKQEVVYDILEQKFSIHEITTDKEDKAYERDSNSDLDRGGGLHSRVRTGTSTLDSRGGERGERTSGNVWEETSGIPEEPQETPIPSDGFQHDTDGTRFRDRQTSRGYGGTSDRPNDGQRGSDRGSQESRPSPLGEIVQQRDSTSEGNRVQRTDLQLESETKKEFEQITLFPAKTDGNLVIGNNDNLYAPPENQENTTLTGVEEQVSSAPVPVSTEKRATTYDDFENVLAHGTGEAGSKERIAEFFEKAEHSQSDKAEFLKNEYGSQDIMVDQYHVRTKEHFGMALEIPDESKSRILPFHRLANIIDGMMERGEYLTAEERPQPEPVPTVEKLEERNTILYSEASEVGKNKVENGIEEDFEIPLFRNGDGKEYAFGFGGLGNGTTVWNYLEQGDDDYKIVGHIATNGALNLRDGTLPQEAVDFLEEKADTFYPTVEVIAEEPELTLEETAEPTSPEVLFFEDFDDLNLDYSQYQDGDLIGYDINGVKFELGEMDGHYFTNTTTAIAPDGQVLGTSMSQENYEKFKAWKEELAQENEVVVEVIPEVENSVEIPENIEKSHHTILWEHYQEISFQHPNDMVLIQNGDFFEILGDNIYIFHQEDNMKTIFRDCNGEQVPVCGFPTHALEDNLKQWHNEGTNVVAIKFNEQGEKYLETFPSDSDMKSIVPARNFDELTQERIQFNVDNFGVDNQKLRNILSMHLNESNIDEFGRFSHLKETIDKELAKKSIEDILGTTVPLNKVNILVDSNLRTFVTGETPKTDLFALYKAKNHENEADKEVTTTLEKGLEFSMDGTDYIVETVSDLTGTVYLKDKNSPINGLEMADKSEILEHLQKEWKEVQSEISQEPAIVDSRPEFSYQKGDMVELTDGRTYEISSIDNENSEVYLSDRSKENPLSNQRILDFTEFQHQIEQQTPDLDQPPLENRPEVPVSERIPVGLEVNIDDSNLIVESIDEKSGYVIFNDQEMVAIGMESVLKVQIEIPRVLEHLEMLEKEEMEQIQEQPTAESSSLPPITTTPEPEVPDFPYKNGDSVELGEDLKYTVLAVGENDVLLQNQRPMMGNNTLTLEKEKFLDLVEKQQATLELTSTPVEPPEPPKVEKSTSETLFEAFQNSAEPDWQENPQKQRKIQGAFHKILDDEQQTKDLFALVLEIEPRNKFEFDRIYNVIDENQGKELDTEQVSGDFAKGEVVNLGGTNYRVNKVEDGEVQLNNSISRPPLTFTKDELQEKLQAQGDLQARKERNIEDLEKIPVKEVGKSQVQQETVPTNKEPSTESSPELESDSKLSVKKSENFKITNPDLGHGTTKEKFQRNVLAIQTLQQIEGEKRTATPEEQEILSNYVGWGGLQEAFDDSKMAWSNEYATLKDLLPEKDYAQAKRTVLDSFYTAPEIIESMYEALEKMGVPKNVKILEPSLGVGNFIGIKPEFFAQATVHGSELDSISGRIATQLYPEAEIQVKGFEKTEFSDESFDVAIGNVPFGDFSVNDPKYNADKLKVHDYFFAKSLDQVKDGGIVAFITSSGTMDKKNSDFREKLSSKADLLGAIRLPNTAFKKNAGTEVTSDIIFLQKRSEPLEITPEWVKLGKNEDGISMNQYFVDNPDMIMGKIELVSGQFGPAPTCQPDTKTTLKEQLSKAIHNLKKPVTELLEKMAVGKIQEQEKSKGERIYGMEVPENTRNFSYFLKDDTIYFKDNDKIFKPEVKKAQEPRIKGMIAIADQTRKVIDLQVENCTDDVLIKEQGILNKLHDDFHKNHGVFAQRGNKSAFKEDISYPLLCSLQTLDDDKNLESKSDIFFKRTVRQTQKITEVNTPVEALGVCIGEKAMIDIPFMEQLLHGKMDSSQIITSLEGIIFKNPMSDMDNPFDGWQNADEYLSGNVREKLEIAEKMVKFYPELASNVEKLKEVQPTKLKATEIDVRIGSTWIDPKFYKQFMFETFNTPASMKFGEIEVSFSKYNNEWNIKGKSVHSNGAMLEKYGTKRKNPYQLLEDCLNLRDTKVNDRVNDTYVLNPVETAKARTKQEIIGEKFQEWIWKDVERRDELVETYNEVYNSIRPREFDGSHIQFDGMTEQIELKQHQKNAVARSLYGENTLLAHCVGAGKSFTMVASAMEGKRLGLHKKSMIAVPKHLVVQMGADVSKLYPSAKVLVATEDDFTPAKREEFCSRVATGDFDVVVLGHTQFTALQFSPEVEEKILKNQIDELTNNILESKDSDLARYTVKKLEKTREQAKTKLEKLKNHNTPTIESIYFDKMGVDKIFIDEAHLFKNLAVHSKMQNVAGVASGESARATDMLAKCQFISEQTNGKGVVFATGTPVSNSMSELFVMMKFLQENTLKKMGLNHFDSWASSFGEKVTSLELAPEGVRYRGGKELAR